MAKYVHYIFFVRNQQITIYVISCVGEKNGKIKIVSGYLQYPNMVMLHWIFVVRSKDIPRYT